MATAEQKREELLNFLDKKGFDPILKASPGDCKDEHRKEILVDVQKKTESEKHRFHENYRTAKEVKENFKSDLSLLVPLIFSPSGAGAHSRSRIRS